MLRFSSGLKFAIVIVSARICQWRSDNPHSSMTSVLATAILPLLAVLQLVAELLPSCIFRDMRHAP